MGHTLEELLSLLEQSNGDDQSYLVQSCLEFARDRGWISGEQANQAIDWVHVGASLDAALTLVPEGMSVDLHIGPRAMLSDAVIHEPMVTTEHHPAFSKDVRVTRWKSHKADSMRDGILRSNSPALALCIAALKARA